MLKNESEQEFAERVKNIQNNPLTAAEVLINLDGALDEIKQLRAPFPLQTIQSLAIRWGVSRQLVNYWRKQHSDFPLPMEGIVTATAKTPLLFSLKDVQQYERVHRKTIAENGTVNIDEGKRTKDGRFIPR